MTLTPTQVTLREKLKVKPPAELSEYLNILIMGHPGAGKTRLAGTAADDPLTSPVLYLDIDGGLRTIQEKDTIESRTVTGIKQLELIWNLLDKERGYYKTVVIDSLGELQKLDMQNIMEAAYNKNPETTDVDVPSQREWGKSQVHIRDIVREYKNLGVHVIFTCHSKVEVSEATKKERILPSLPGKLAAEIAGFLDIVGLLEVERVRVRGDDDKTSQQVVRALKVQSDGVSIVKDRTDKLGDVVYNPTIPKIWKLING